MRKETVNTFSGGLNYDLNPITTPNNVLTECINGSFITFNGDELALQNDAGNTKILIPNIDPDAPAEYVTLTEGFYPLGVKEYGGVLYIVSGNPTTNKIEFGSYPSPDILDNTEENAANVFSFINPTSTTLYNPKVINNNSFRPGEYIVFSGNSLDTTNVSYQKYLNGIYQITELKIYDVKLYLQLTNGFIDLTNDVWYDYAKFVEVFYEEDLNQTTTRFWFNDVNFKYHCKSSFKGKLVLSVELEDLILYKLNYYIIDQDPGTEEVPSQGYKLTFNISFNNGTTWNIQKLRISYTLDGIATIPQDFTVLPTGDYTIYTPFSNEGKVLNFEITPIFYNNTTTEVNGELPEIYLDKYTIFGSELLSTYFNYDAIDYDTNDYY